jgi:hypothetical protein
VERSAALQVAVVHAPFLRRAFHTVPLDARDWAVCVAVASTVLWAVELRKVFARTRRRAAAEVAGGGGGANLRFPPG